MKQLAKTYISHFLFFIFFGIASTGSTQESRLAIEYFKNGEFEKATNLFKKLSDKNENSDYFFDYYIKSLLESDQEAIAEKELKEKLKRFPDKSSLYLTYGKLLEDRNETEKAQKQYDKAIGSLPADVSKISRLAGTFVLNLKYDLAIETYLKGQKLLNNENEFARKLGSAYLRKGDKDKMIKYYLLSLNDEKGSIANIQNTLHSQIKTEEEFALLKENLFGCIQKYPNNERFPALLSWTYIQNKDYQNAFRQARSIDREKGESGHRVLRLASLAEEDKAFDIAIEAYNYIVESKGRTSSNYINAKRSVLRCKKKQILLDYKISKEEVTSLKGEYQLFLDEFGINSATAEMAQEFANFLALYANDLPGAIKMLSSLTQMGGIPKELLANIKVDLADYFLIDGNIWESTLLYSQVDKAHTEEYIGELARFKNAKFSYYIGDFEWAQAQFDILKSATSRLISNDAIDLSVFIMDNLGLDTTAVPLSMFARAELLAYQNKYDDAFSTLDSIIYEFPNHGLKDDILYTQANIHIKMQNFNFAEKAYQEIIKEFPEEIRCDNALFELAELNENQLENKEQAQKLYEQLFIDYSNSTFAIEARKRYRKLRGDNVQ